MDADQQLEIRLRVEGCTILHLNVGHIAHPVLRQGQGEHAAGVVIGGRGEDRDVGDGGVDN